MKSYHATTIGRGVVLNTPTADGTAGQFMTTDGNKTLGFADAAGGSGVPLRGAYWSDTNTLTSSFNWTFDGSDMILMGMLGINEPNPSHYLDLYANAAIEPFRLNAGPSFSGSTLFEVADQGSIKMAVDSNGRTGVGAAAAQGLLHVFVAAAGVTANPAADAIVVEAGGNSGISILTPAANSSSIYFGSPTTATGGVVQYNSSSNLFLVGTNDPGCELWFRAGSNSDAARMDDNATAGETRLRLWDVDTGALVRVSVGANDSGGAGFKVLRVPN